MGVDLRLLGGFSARRDGAEIPPAAFGGRLPRKLVRILLTRRGELVPSDLLVEVLWPRRPPTDPRANLKVLVSRARHALGDPSLITTGIGGYALTADDGCVVDADVFRATVARAQIHLAAGRAGVALREFRDSLGLWAGEPLLEDAYDDWARAWRQELTGAHVEALEGAATAALQVHDPAEAVALAQRAVAIEPLRERANLVLVRALAAAGDRVAAVAAFQAYRHRLADELGLDPSVEAVELELRLLRAESLGLPPRRGASPIPPAGLEEVSFVGRDRELGVIEAALGPTGSGVVTLAGRSGSGKSRLLGELGLRSEVPVLAVRAFPAARTEPWVLARSLLTEALGLDVEAARAVPERAVHVLADVVPEIAEFATTAPGPVVADSRRALLLEGATRLVEAATAPIALLVVDDLQWADASSIELMALINGRVEGLRLVVAYRPEEIEPTSPVAGFLDDLQRASRLPVSVDLAPLDAAAIASLVVDDDLAAVLCDCTDRRPLAVTEVLRRLVQHDVLYRDPRGRWRSRSHDAVQLAREAAQEGQQRMVVARARRLPPRRRELLSLLALAGRETPAAVLGHALGTGQPGLHDELDLLARSELARLGEHGWATAHDSIAETIAHHLGREERGRLHAMLAAALRAVDAGGAETAAHLAGAGDVEGAATAFADAARDQLERFATHEAEELAERGLPLTSRGDTVARLLEVRAEARARRGDLTSARADLREALGHRRDHAARARILSRMAALSLGAEDIERGAERAELALVEAGGEPAARAAALVVAAVADMNLGRPERAEERYAEALETFQQLGDVRGMADVVSARAMATFMAGDLRGAVRQFRRAADLLEDAGDLLGAMTPRTTAGHALVFMAQPQEALSEVDATMELARTLGNPDGLATTLAIRGEALCGLGRIEESLATAAEAVAVAAAIGHRAWGTLALRGLGIARQAAGDLPGAEDAFRRSLAMSAVPVLAGWTSAALARLLIARGALVEAGSLIRGVLEDGPPLTRNDGRLAQVELAAARHDPDTGRLARTALELARISGHLISVPRLEELANP